METANLIIRKQRDLFTHLGCKVETTTIFDPKSRMTQQEIVLSTSRAQQRQDELDLATRMARGLL